MSQPTAFEKLDDAIHEFLQESGALQEGGAVSGWLLLNEASYIVDDENALPLATSTGYTFGPQTSLAQALGLASYGSAVFSQNMLSRGQGE